MEKSRFDDFVRRGYRHIPIYEEANADTETALGVYLKLANTPYSYLFESAEGGERWGRYSIIGLAAKTVIRVFDNDVQILKNGTIVETTKTADPLSWIENYRCEYHAAKLDELPGFQGGLVGYFGYEIIRYIEPKLRHINQPDELEIADILLMQSENLVVFDNFANQVYLMTYVDPTQNSYEDGVKTLKKMRAALARPIIFPAYKSPAIRPEDFRSSFGRENYERVVEKIRRYIIAGDVMQVVPSQRLSVAFKAPPIELYRRLRRLNPSPYMYFLNLDDVVVVGSSPEILVKVENDRAILRPIAGTRSRGKNAAEDRTLEKDLLADEKEIAEHLMLIDLGRNDLGRIAETGTVVVTAKMTVEYYSHVMHIVSNIECRLRAGMRAMDVLRATFPAGTLSGAPKIRAMEIINEVETIKRNIYSGAIGYLSWHGSMDTAIAIRTAVIKNQKLYLQVGGGVVHDSTPEGEWRETMDKARALMKAVEAL